MPCRIQVKIYDELGKKYYQRDLKIPYPTKETAIDVERMLSFNESLLGKPVPLHHDCDIEDNEP